MKKKNKIIQILLIILMLIIFIILTYYGIIQKNKKENLIDENVQNDYDDMVKNTIMYDNNATLDDLKNEYKITGQEDLYEIDTEYDGRKVLSIKPDINYKVAFCGMIKKSKPSFDELEVIFNGNSPKETGIWINEQSRERIINFLNNSEKLSSKYAIDELGYIQILDKRNQNDLDIEIEKLINGDIQYVFDISSICYMIDPVTGEIVENAYNDLEEYQTYEYFVDENRMIMFITENKEQKLTNNEIFESILEVITIQ